MVDRRSLLAAAAGVGASLGGCLTAAGLARTGYLQLQAVGVAWTHEGRQYRDEVLFATYDGEGQPRGRVAEEYRGLVQSVDDVRVEGELADELERTFTDVRYVVGFCWADGECRNPTASRGEFNRLQFGDRAEVRFEHPDVRVLDVYEDAQASVDDWGELTTVDFSELHADDGVPVE